MKLVRIFIALLIAIISVIYFASPALAFCGFYVAKADTKLYNQASQVIIARNGDRNILTMANDYQGDVKDFALVVPVPVVLEKEQVHVGESKIIERLDGFSAPRLVEYFDPDPCTPPPVFDGVFNAAPAPASPIGRGAREEALGVTIEAQFTVGEYDIVILSAKESNGLETWLKQNNYRIPSGASRLLQPYIRQGMKFFVAKVNLAEFEKAGYQLLRPLQMAYESPRFMLPIRLGMVNSKSEQDLLVYILSPQGQAEVTNYRTVQIPSDAEIPLFVKEEFSNFYKAMFKTSYQREGKKVAFLEYAWNMAWCDPCAAEPLTNEELKKAGVFWLNPNQPNNVFITRLHVRYTANKFPEDLIFQETGNTQQFQGRYILRHPFTGEMNCDAGKNYQKLLPARFEEEAQTLAKLTGWKIQNIRRKMDISESQPENWWSNIWQ
ncbi:MAG TPA: DUF2330 domain-containing protein [Cyanobacteria bacterium UBA11149]|nr:DUF2330 domain-containing protein [Cyanobacteria bacterium UBA11367]HBE56545.1 DUF2330 domain-containing protein [Cyanobacteria bacterium UBA11366]HBK62361.1 DUF2330 domain-containing protein [Cyanobacteria bacterium UBA11166]HBR75666.1 DUF2330 domain-containing protein [Cyanobacteria bacterium UBA11159]HBS68596.1 DUF2330 domain-containing protein [Cyanobacteria bacterium UBA11153]HBW91129.1 DUF2330 domain-containing protein [Cyanobacteria bacterium UBA11149]HCA97989.1 DUF2330 domain-conta